MEKLDDNIKLKIREELEKRNIEEAKKKEIPDALLSELILLKDGGNTIKAIKLLRDKSEQRIL